MDLNWVNLFQTFLLPPGRTVLAKKDVQEHSIESIEYLSY